MMIDDNSVFVYGCLYVVSCVVGVMLLFFFGVNGDYDVYDFCSFGEYWCNDDLCVVMIGKFVMGLLWYELMFGVSV